MFQTIASCHGPARSNLGAWEKITELLERCSILHGNAHLGDVIKGRRVQKTTGRWLSYIGHGSCKSL